MARVDQRDIDEYLTAVLDKDEAEARKLVEGWLTRGMGMGEVFDVLTEAQTTVGELWERGVIGVSDEHFATKATLGCIDLVTERLPRFRRERRGIALLCTVESEFHHVGLRMFSELLRDQGWETEFLGTLPSFGLLLERAKKRGGVDLICLSATMPSSLPALVSMLKSVRAEPFFAETRIVVGGAAFRSRWTRDSWLSVGGARGLADCVSENRTSALKYTGSMEKAMRDGNGSRVGAAGRAAETSPPRASSATPRRRRAATS